MFQLPSQLLGSRDQLRAAMKEDRPVKAQAMLRKCLVRSDSKFLHFRLKSVVS